MTAEEKRERERQKRAAEISRVTSIYYQGALSAEEEKKQQEQQRARGKKVDDRVIMRGLNRVKEGRWARQGMGVPDVAELQETRRAQEREAATHRYLWHFDAATQRSEPPPPPPERHRLDKVDLLAQFHGARPSAVRAVWQDEVLTALMEVDATELGQALERGVDVREARLQVRTVSERNHSVRFYVLGDQMYSASTPPAQTHRLEPQPPCRSPRHGDGRTQARWGLTLGTHAGDSRRRSRRHGRGPARRRLPFRAARRARAPGQACWPGVSNPRLARGHMP